MSFVDSIIKEFDKHAFALLKRDGLFVKATQLSNDQILLVNTSYITDTDDGQDIDCLVVHEDDLGLGGSCVCEDITTGQWLQTGIEPVRGCVACPVCHRLAKPWKLQMRQYCVVVKVDNHHLTLINSQPNANLKAMPVPMSEKIIGQCNTLFPEWSHG